MAQVQSTFMYDGDIYSLDVENRSKGIRVFIHERSTNALVTDLENNVIVHIMADAAQNEGFLRLKLFGKP